MSRVKKTWLQVRKSLLKELHMRWNIPYAFSNTDRIVFGKIKSITLLEKLLDCETRTEVKTIIRNEYRYYNEGMSRNSFWDER